MSAETPRRPAHRDRRASSSSGRPDAPPHYRRDIAEAFGDDADRYDRARPRYPEELADTVMAGVPGRRILDVGIGTGLSALPFRDRGAQVLGVEVDARMAKFARSRGFTVEVSRFEDWDPCGRRFDIVIAGQTWHWLDPLAGALKATHVLARSGRLAVFWNIAEPEPDVAVEFADVYQSVDTGLPFTPWTVPAFDAYEKILSRSEEGILAARAFTDPVRRTYSWRSTLGKRAWLDQVPTSGGHSRIPPERLDELLDGLGRVIDTHGGAITIRYATVVLTADISTAR